MKAPTGGPKVKPVGLSLKIATIDELDQLRGAVPRSSFAEQLLQVGLDVYRKSVLMEVERVDGSDTWVKPKNVEAVRKGLRNFARLKALADDPANWFRPGDRRR
jgi:hypothetical protein